MVKRERWLQRFLRLPARPLQIPEILAMAGEHLQVAAMSGLRRRYLPVSLSVAVSSEDFRGLRPFIGELQSEMQQVLKRLAERPRYVALSSRLQVHVLEARDLTLGSPPRFHTLFPEGDRRMAWTLKTPPAPPVPEKMPVLEITAVPEAATDPEAGARPGAAAGPETLTLPAAGCFFELVLTVASTQQTGLQSVYWLSLEPLLSTHDLDLGAPPSRWILAADGQIRDAASGAAWPGVPATIHELGKGVPVELDGSVDIPPRARSSKLCRFHRPGSPGVLWAPQGLLLVGRREELVHWVPAAAPRNLSGRHFALLQGTPSTLRIVDLGSTNGTYLAGHRLQPFERVQIAPPETFEIGNEGALQLSLRRLPLSSG